MSRIHPDIGSHNMLLFANVRRWRCMVFDFTEERNESLD